MNTTSKSVVDDHTYEVPGDTASWAICILIAYLLLVRLLRYRTSTKIQNISNQKYTSRKSYTSMTLDDAWSIIVILSSTEFPSTFSISVFFALFKTYGIPRVSSLLVSTGQLAGSGSLQNTSKRAADTGVLLTNMVFNPPSSPRVLDSIARMNYLHNRHRRAGKIANDDMLYTLSLFALEPIRWTDRDEWRTLTDLERCALGTYWKYIGEAMEISFSVLEGNEHEWQDGLVWLEDMERWSVAYQAREMVPAKSNHTLAVATFELALFKLPSFLHGVGRGFASAMIEPQLRKAMMIPEPKKFYTVILSVFMHVRKLILRHLMLPRPYFLRKRWIPEHPDPQTGRYHSLRYRAHPWYIKEKTYSKWHPSTWLVKSKRRPAEHNYMSEGYVISEVGPEALREKGAEDMEEQRQRMESLKASSGCPFAQW